MSTEVRVPTTGNAGEAAVIIGWNVGVGSRIGAGEVLVVIETSKSTIDVESPVSGEVLKLLFDVGDEAPEHEVLAIIGEPGEAVTNGHALPTDTAPAVGETAAMPSTPAKAEHSAGVSTPIATEHTRIASSPRARILANRNGIDLSTVTGSGPGGRIIVGDVLAAEPPIAHAATATVPTPVVLPYSAPRPMAKTDDFVLAPVRGARKITAQRMHESLQATAQVTLTRYAKADALLSYVRRLRSVTEAGGMPKIGINDAVLFATARAVVKHPEANSWFEWDGIRQFTSVNLGFAVDTGQALLVPVIPHANTLSLAQIAAAANAAIDQSRAGKLSTPEMEGGTFTVSNLGSLGVHWFTPVLNPPQSCILGVGAAHQLHDDGPSLLPLSLTFDHRAIDGAAAALLLADIAGAIETIDLLAAF